MGFMFSVLSVEEGYRFIWRKPNGNLQPARGQARIPEISDINYLVKAMEQLEKDINQKE